MTTLLQLVQQAKGEMGLDVPSIVVGSTVDTDKQCLYLLNAIGAELQRQFPWQAITTEYRFTTQFTTLTGTASSGSAIITGLSSTSGLDTTYMAVGTGVPQDTYISVVNSGSQVTLTQNVAATGSIVINFCKTKYSFPSDYDRPIDRTQWDKSKHWEMLGPETPQQWQWLKSGYIATGPRLRFRPLGGAFQIWPPISTEEYLGFEYISKNWVTAADGTTKSSFTADTDTCVFPDRLMILGLKLKFFEVKGFDTTAYARDYLMELNISKSTDIGAKTLSMAPKPSDYLIGWDQIPDSGYGA